MAVSIEAQTQEFAEGVTARATTKVQVAPALRAAAQQQANASGGQTLPGVNVQDFIDAHRIHIKDGSLFVDPYLVLHPRELDPAPETEAKLRKKLALTYSLNSPSFFESSARSTIALNLGGLLPVSTTAKHSRLLEEIKQFNTQVDTGIDAGLSKELQDKQTPLAAIVRDVTQHPGSDPVGLETLKNSLSVYLLVREKLTQNGYLDKLTNYVVRTNTPDQIIADLAHDIGTTPIAFREAALKGGVDGIGALLGLDPAYVADVKKLTEYAATQDFGYNPIEHWHLGRQLQGLPAPMSEKIAVGLDARITAKIDEYRNRVHHHFDVPEPVKKEEKRIADALNLLDPVQRALMFKQGYEVCFTPEYTADEIAFHRGVHGLNRRAVNDPRDLVGTFRLYISGHGDLELSMQTFVHEVAHIFFPDQFTPEQVAKIDGLVASDQKRFVKFQALMDDHYPEFEKLFKAYQAGTAQEKAAVIEATNQKFAAYDMHVEGLFPYLREARDFQFAVKRASDTLSVEGERYNRSGYNAPQERFREVISRFAEIKQVKYRGEPEFLQFLAPGLNNVWENSYLPHLQSVYQGLESGTIKTTHSNAVTKDQAPVVEQPPTVPFIKPIAQAPAPLQADFIDTSLPLATIDAASVERLTPALNTLSNMGVNVSLNR